MLSQSVYRRTRLPLCAAPVVVTGRLDGHFLYDKEILGFTYKLVSGINRFDHKNKQRKLKYVTT
jgi:hypothetical protein